MGLQQVLNENDRFDSDNKDWTGKTNSNSRPSLGDRIRNYITGNSNIRLRDYLFDVDLDVRATSSPISSSEKKTNSRTTGEGRGVRRINSKNRIPRSNIDTIS